MSVAADFAAVGAKLLERAAAAGRANRGTFVGGSASLLALVALYAEAARNGFRVLGADDTASPDAQAAAMAVASSFGHAAGVLASSFGGAVTTLSLAPLLTGAALASAFTADAPGVVVSPAARDALEALRGDPLDLLARGRAAVEGLMQTVADGVELR